MSAILDSHGLPFPRDADPLPTSPSVREQRREHHETWLYYHLVNAAKARAALARETSWSEYEDARIDRASALDRASQHYRALLALGCVIEPLLDQMSMNEGLTP